MVTGFTVSSNFVTMTLAGCNPENRATKSCKSGKRVVALHHQVAFHPGGAPFEQSLQGREPPGIPGAAAHGVDEHQVHAGKFEHGLPHFRRGPWHHFQGRLDELRGPAVAC